MNLHTVRLPTYTELSPDERGRRTQELLTRAAGLTGPARDACLDEVVTLNLRVARAVAGRYAGRDVPLEDLEQAAFEGLVKAVRRFDVAQERDLLSYAVPTIRGEVLRYFRDRSWAIRPPRRLQDLQWEINRAVEHLGFDLGRPPTADELSAHLGIDRREYDEAVACFGCMNPPSFDQPIAGHEELTIADTLADTPDGESTEQEAAETRTMLAPALHRLSERDRNVVYLRFFEDRNQREIGEQYGVAQVQVSRWLGRILDELRASLESRGREPA